MSLSSSEPARPQIVSPQTISPFDQILLVVILVFTRVGWCRVLFKPYGGQIALAVNAYYRKLFLASQLNELLVTLMLDLETPTCKLSLLVLPFAGASLADSLDSCSIVEGILSPLEADRLLLNLRDPSFDSEYFLSR